MAKVLDAPPDVFIDRLSVILQEEKVVSPVWISFVKSGVQADRQPQDRNWWYKRCASIFRKIYLHGPVGINDLKGAYGGGKPHSYGAAHHKDAGGSIIRTAVHELERLGYVEKKEKKGRVVSSIGMKKLDRLATDILKELSKENPMLKVYL